MPDRHQFIRLSVEDSGPGIPLEKRDALFAKFQESLDVLNQGTGIGLFLCKSLVELLNGTIYLDEDYDSGVPGNPGTRFVIDLPASSIEDDGDGDHDSSSKAFNMASSLPHPSSSVLRPQSASLEVDLPENLSVLFVDDDAILRKLFARTIKTVRPGWTTREAASGETALRLLDESNHHFDLIFVDMYLASIQKQMLGTETVQAMLHLLFLHRICFMVADSITRILLEGLEILANVLVQVLVMLSAILS